MTPTPQQRRAARIARAWRARAEVARLVFDAGDGGAVIAPVEILNDFLSATGEALADAEKLHLELARRDDDARRERAS